MLKRAVDTCLPTEFGEFLLRAYTENGSTHPHLALIQGAVEGACAPLVRIHSECMTGDVFSSQRCDCGIQLEVALQMIGSEGSGVLIYLRQEGRGIGLLNKLRAYRLQDGGLDTVDANLRLGFGADEREYGVAVAILEDLGVSTVRLLTNNPAKIAAFDQSSIQVVERMPLEVPVTDHNRGYLAVKRLRMGHFPEEMAR
ncbi:MAG: 3,4-dihydroxy 2-butanone 4-phosphate synthase / cyclohydrolase [Solirubrobacteraceae bacterium]|jgi:3,4-dihydroxy 2-butanone 4-phosphate synthase/GTP cyclohydrolase II|nr:3,4-dihydroxy 2-butanone 4-phosphate synthase / cyclohydrolase [Solirubrobacteraceae bacterium]